MRVAFAVIGAGAWGIPALRKARAVIIFRGIPVSRVFVAERSSLPACHKERRTLQRQSEQTTKSFYGTAAEKNGHSSLLKALAPFVWPQDRPDLKRRMVFA